METAMIIGAALPPIITQIIAEIQPYGIGAGVIGFLLALIALAVGYPHGKLGAITSVLAVVVFLIGPGILENLKP